MARYDFSKQLSASVTVNNLLDKKYYTIFQLVQHLHLGGTAQRQPGNDVQF